MGITRLRGNLQIKSDSVTSDRIKDYTVTAIDIAPGTLTGVMFVDGSIPDSKLSANVTLEGNIFNGPDQLVRLDGAGILPALDGSALTNLPGGGSSQWLDSAPDIYFTAGKVGIGTATALVSSLDVKGFSLGSSMTISSFAGDADYPVIRFRQGVNDAYGFDVTLDAAVDGDLQWHAVLGGVPTRMMTFGLDTGNVAIGTADPDLDARLHVAGIFKLVDGSQQAGYVLTSDAVGLATWAAPSGGGPYAVGAGLRSIEGQGLGNSAGGVDSVVSGGDTNAASGLRSFVGGGQNNTASARDSSVVGGAGNTANFRGAFIGGGTNNSASSGQFAVIGGGNGNIISDHNSVIGGGDNNYVSAVRSFIGGGTSNSIVGQGASVVVGGSGNSISNKQFSSIGGGRANIATGRAATVPGGEGNSATGDWSFAAGNFAQADQHRSFVWSDGSAAQTARGIPNTFNALATGGAFFDVPTFEITGQIQINGGTPGVGNVLVSDAAGLSTWASILTDDGNVVVDEFSGDVVFA